MSKSEEYWRKREEEQRKKNIEDEEEYAERIKYYYRQEMNAIEDRIYAFYVRYSTKEGITMAEARRRVSKMDVEEFAEMAAKYVKEKDFSDRANEELRLYNLTMRVNHQQLLMYQIAMESCATADELEQFVKSKLEGRTIDEIERQAGILGESLLDQKEMVGSIVNASFHNATFSDRIWANQALLRSNLSNILTNALIQGRNPRDYVKQIRRAFDVSRGQAERLLRTELARVQSEAQLRSYEKAEFDMYTFHALGDACSVCAALDGEHFEVKEAEPGINLPPMHPNCRCSTGPYMDTEEFDEWLDGIDEHGLTFEEWKKKIKSPKDLYDYGDSAKYRKYNGEPLNSEEEVKEYYDALIINKLARSKEVEDFILNEMRYMPKRDLELLKKRKVIIGASDSGSYYRNMFGFNYIAIDKNPYPGMFAHEFAHFAVRRSKFNSGLRECIDNVISNGISFKPVDIFGSAYYFAQSSMFIRPYQGMTYIKVKGKKEELEYSYNAFLEYPSVGYECYILNPTELYKKDKKLYDYFERGGLLDED